MKWFKGREVALALGLNVVDSKVVYPAVAEAFGMELHNLGF